MYPRGRLKSLGVSAVSYLLLYTYAMAILATLVELQLYLILIDAL